MQSLENKYLKPKLELITDFHPSKSSLNFYILILKKKSIYLFIYFIDLFIYLFIHLFIYGTKVCVLEDLC
jgi:hypothetical protein